MRVLYVLNALDPGGAEHGLLTLCRNGFFAHQDLHILAFCRGHGALADELREIVGHRLVIADPTPILTITGCLKGAWALFNLARSLRPQATVLSLKQANVVGRVVLCIFPRIRCISFEHIGRYRSRRLQFVYGILLKFLSIRVNEIWADCRETLVDTRSYFFRSEREVEIVPLFAAPARNPSKLDYRRGKALRCAVAGRLVDRKRLDIVIDALELLRGRGIDVRLDVFGDGPERPKLEARAAAAGVGAMVAWRGYLKDWTPEAAKADIFLNLGETEGFCIVVAEAMAAGLPVIARDVGGIRDYGADGVNMLKLCVNTSAPELAAAMARLAEDEPLRRRLGARARRDMCREYAVGRMAATGERIFRRIERLATRS